jgi:regulatory factor X, other
MTNSNHGKRSRSTTTASSTYRDTKRPVSRASTESFQSNEQHEYAQISDSHSHVNQQVSLGTNFSITANEQSHHDIGDIESALLGLRTPQTQQHDTFDTQHYHASREHPAPFVNNEHPLPVHIYSEQHAVKPVQNDAAQELDGRRKGGNSAANNDKEMRELLVRNDGRTLSDVAAEVLSTERTPRAERSKQLFAMIW